MDITVEVLAYGTEIYLVTEPYVAAGKSIAPLRYCGTFHYRGGRPTWECEPDKLSMEIMGGSIVHFAEIVKAKLGAELEAEQLEALYQLPDSRG